MTTRTMGAHPTQGRSGGLGLSPIALGAVLAVSIGCTGIQPAPTAPSPAYEALAEVPAEVPCTDRTTNDGRLCQPRTIRAAAGSDIDTCFRIEMRDWCKAAVTGADGVGRKVLVPFPNPACQERDRIALRTYGSPKVQGAPCTVGDPAAYHWSIPAPTFRLLHPSAGEARGKGQGFGIELVNELPVVDEGCKGGEKPPNCFHGDNTTNLHFHGFRVSPEPPQDFVFLQLKPKESYRYQVDPILPIQPVGTQWYHPHKHGSTAIQVANGMAGAFTVHGYLDDAIRRSVPGLRERVLVVQQIFPNLAHFPTPGENGLPPRPDRSLWVNGMSKPIVEAYAGEIQWWRMVAAMQQTSSQFLLDFPFPARQIAQDGIPFSRENHDDQPLDLSAPRALFGTAVFDFVRPLEASPDAPGETPTIHFAAGNRVDVLVQAPPVAVWPSSCRENGRPKAYCDFGAQATQIAPLAAEAAEDMQLVGDLLTLRVWSSRQIAHRFPEMPERPAYLRLEPVTDQEVGARKKTVIFSADVAAGSDPPPNFCIDGAKYSHDRIDHCLEVGTAAEWRLENRAPSGVGLIAHPFHIHTNPFELRAINGEPKPSVWFDTFPLPTTDATPPNLTIRHRFVGYAGEYVLHCHILGHEDRGMMQNVKAFLPGTRCVEAEKKVCDTCPCP